MRALITQSNYIPWKGYFDNIALADVFVIYDDMQYTKRDWRNRNKIKTSHGLKWLTIPVEVKGKFFQKINETKVSDPSWNRKHLDILFQNYRKSKHFLEEKDWIEDLYMDCKSPWLTEINRHFIESICKKLEIETEIRDSREFQLHGDKSEKLANLCSELECKKYLTGPAAKAYMDEEPFEKLKIQIEYSDYTNYPEYDQVYTPFEHGVSILDLICCTGERAKSFMKYTSE